MDTLERWEYDMVILPLRQADAARDGELRLPRDLNARGADGWELVTAVVRSTSYESDLVCIFKRRRVD